MRKFIFIMGTAILALSMNACKTQQKAADNANNASTSMSTGSTLVEKYWKLIELYGHPINANNNNQKEAHIIFKAEGNRFNGDAGCNRIAGSYQLGESGEITFSQVVATRMMCLNMDTETQFLQMLEKANRYIVENDTLTIFPMPQKTPTEPTKPLAHFVAVYLR